jgi:polar amino acid transport system substrate-binding protein
MTLTIATDDWPPYEFKVDDPGKEHITGFSTEVIQAVLKRMNVGINGRINQYPWVRGEKMVIDGTVDMLYTASTNEKRAKITHYPKESLMESSWSFFIRKEDADRLKYNSFNDLKGKKIGVVRAYTYTPELWEFMEKEKNFDEVTNDELNVKKLMVKRIDYVAMDFGNGMALIKKMGLTDQIIVLKKPIKTTSLFAIFSQKTVKKDFADKFSSELKAFKATTEYKTLFNKYFGK